MNCEDAPTVMSKFWSGFRVHLGGIEPRSESSSPFAHSGSRPSDDDSPDLVLVVIRTDICMIYYSQQDRPLPRERKPGEAVDYIVFGIDEGLSSSRL